VATGYYSLQGYVAVVKGYRLLEIPPRLSNGCKRLSIASNRLLGSVAVEKGYRLQLEMRLVTIGSVGHIFFKISGPLILADFPFLKLAAR
jgi:hypothetical protein